MTRDVDQTTIIRYCRMEDSAAAIAVVVEVPTDSDITISSLMVATRHSISNTVTMAPTYSLGHSIVLSAVAVEVGMGCSVSLSIVRAPIAITI